jgi:hypothetical protein
LGRAAGFASGSLFLALLTLILWGTRISPRVPDREVRSGAIAEAQDRAEVRP